MVSYSSAILALAASMASTTSALELTASTFDEMTAGKTVFLKMYAPWCGHCKAMAADWEKVEKDFEGHAIAFVASVDCTNPENMQICQDAGVQGYPTVVWGDATAPQSYEGGRNYAALKAFADEYVTKPVCSIYNEEPCTETQKAAIASTNAKTDDELLEIAKTVFEQEKAAEKEFDAYVEKLQEEFEKMQDAHDKKINELKAANNFGYASAILKKRGVKNPYAEMDLEDDDDDLLDGEDLSGGEL